MAILQCTCEGPGPCPKRNGAIVSESFRQSCQRRAAYQTLCRERHEARQKAETQQRTTQRRSLGLCSHLSERVPQSPCRIPLHQCDHFGDLTSIALRCPGAQRCCVDCPEHTGRLHYQQLARFDQHNLWPGVSGMRFNASILADGDGYLFAARNGWAGSEIYLGRLTADLQPVGEPMRLKLRHREAAYGREDPRLFRFRGKAHVAFVGVTVSQRAMRTSVLYARLGDGGNVEKVFYPRIVGRKAWEKNISFFEHDGQLYAVYYTHPRHRILKVDENETSWAHETPSGIAWHGGEIRGGASPVRAGGEYWHFFHDRVGRKGKQCYRTGLVAFEAAPPFRVTRYIPEPILIADAATNKDNYADVVFPCGAVHDGGRWLLSHGQHDRFCTIDAFDHASLERRLVPA